MATRHPSRLRELEKLEAALGIDMLDSNTPIEIVREQLRAAGGAPERIRYEAAVLVDNALAQLETTPVRSTPRVRRPAGMTFGRMNKEQLVRHVNALRANPAAERVLRSRFSNSQPEVISEDELRSLLEEFESLFDEEDDGTK
jgi:hypothetical protein